METNIDTQNRGKCANISCTLTPVIYKTILTPSEALQAAMEEWGPPSEKNTGKPLCAAGP